MYGLKRKEEEERQIAYCGLCFALQLFSVYASASHPVFSAVFFPYTQSVNSACIYIAPMAPTPAIRIWMQPLFCMFSPFVLVI